MRRGNVFRLPSPPVLSNRFEDGPENNKLISEHLKTLNEIVNQAFTSFQGRLNTIQQVKAKTPPNVSGLTVAGKQGLFHLTWNRIENTDGYVVVQASDTSMVNLIGRYNIPDGDQVSHQIPVGNVAMTSSFQVYAYQGNQYSEPSPIVTATTSVYGSSESAPQAPPIAPRQPKKAPIRNGLTLP